MKTGHVHLSNIMVKRGGRVILRVDDRHISAGEFVGIIGTNGAGKTTFLKLCLGLIRPTHGRVMHNGRNITRMSGWRKSNLRKLVGYIPQTSEYNADLPFTLREVVLMGRTGVKPLLSKLTRQDHNLVEYWLDNLGLAGQSLQTFRSLSGGEQQKVLIARAMAAEPSMLILDEPGANLDFNWKKQLADILDRLYKQTQVTIIMVSHETNLLPSSCERIMLLHRGEIIADGPIESTLRSPELEKAYQCPVQVVNIDDQWYAICKASK